MMYEKKKNNLKSSVDIDIIATMTIVTSCKFLLSGKVHFNFKVKLA